MNPTREPIHELFSGLARPAPSRRSQSADGRPWQTGAQGEAHPAPNAGAAKRKSRERREHQASARAQARFWSRSAQSGFYGQDDALALNGDVRSTMFSADYSKGRMVTGGDCPVRC